LRYPRTDHLGHMTYGSKCRNNVNRITLTKRFKGESISKQDAVSYISKTLTNAEENVLVRYINNLNARRLPSTFQIVKNLAEEIANKNLKFNWTTKFLQRKKIYYETFI
jgi:hypothetical protein